jgi:hypothetical protein
MPDGEVRAAVAAECTLEAVNNDRLYSKIS